MVIQIFDFVTNTIIQVVSATGYVGLFLLMVAESCGAPASSTIIMPFSGFLVAIGRMNFWVAVTVGTLANLTGSILIYFISLKGGRPLLKKYGRYILISNQDLDKSNEWFAKYGEVAVFFSRLFPIIRTAISFPAGVSKMNFKKFIIFSFLGTLLWNIALVFLGVRLQNNWEIIRGIIETFGSVIMVLLFLVIGMYIWHHIKKPERSL